MDPNIPHIRRIHDQPERKDVPLLDRQGIDEHLGEVRLQLEATLQYETALGWKNSAMKRRLLRVEAVNRLAGDVNFYDSSFLDRVHPESRLPFRISPEPFSLPDTTRESVEAYGAAIVTYYKACESLAATLPDDHR